MTPSPTAQHLRERASVLRALARQLQQLRVLSLHIDAGPGTWLGPSPQRCADAMRATRVALLGHVDDLLQCARRLEHAAAELDALPQTVSSPR